MVDKSGLKLVVNTFILSIDSIGFTIRLSGRTLVTDDTLNIVIYTKKFIFLQFSYWKYQICSKKIHLHTTRATRELAEIEDVYSLSCFFFPSKLSGYI